MTSVANGLVKSLTHTKGNTTGITNLFVFIGGKGWSCSRRPSPPIKRVAHIQCEIVGNGEKSPALPSIEEAARALEVKIIEILEPYEDDIVRGTGAFATDPTAE